MENSIEMKEETNSNSSNEKIYQKFKVERKEWADKISNYSQRLKDIYSLADLLTDVYSQRQIALEYSHELMSHLIKLNKIFREKRQERHDYYSRYHDLRLDKETKNEHISQDLTNIVERKEMIQNHLDYMRETVKTIDNIGFGVKHRISLEEYRRG